MKACYFTQIHCDLTKEEKLLVNVWNYFLFTEEKKAVMIKSEYMGKINRIIVCFQTMAQSWLM